MVHDFVAITLLQHNACDVFIVICVMHPNKMCTACPSFPAELPERSQCFAVVGFFFVVVKSEDPPDSRANRALAALS